MTETKPSSSKRKKTALRILAIISIVMIFSGLFVLVLPHFGVIDSREAAILTALLMIGGILLIVIGIRLLEGKWPPYKKSDFLPNV